MNKLPAFKAIRKAGVPICAVETSDPAQTQVEFAKAISNGKSDLKFCAWDLCRGLYGINRSGIDFASAQNGDTMTNPSECLAAVYNKGPENLILFFHSAHKILEDSSAAQAVWNIRDKFKECGSCLVLLAPSLKLPPLLKYDVALITEPLPESDELESITKKIASEAEITLPKDSLPVIVDTLRGLSAFAAEQALAMSVSKADGISLDSLWERKRKMIEQTPGLQVWKGGETFEQLGGIQNLKDFLTKVLTSGKTPVRAIGFIDEIEKGLAGSGGDTSGTSQDQLQVFLKVMQDLDIPGIILVGPPGTGKSAISKAAGAVAECPVVAIDTGAMKASLVGESEGRIRAAMEVFKAVSQGKGLFIATCNKIASLPPELRRRFTLGTFFVDLPNAEERKAIWKTWAARYGLAIVDNEIMGYEGWTGAEIRACCDVAFRTGLSLKEAATFVVPVIKSAPDQIEALRKLASGRFISANRPGIYDMNANQQTAKGRKFEE